MNIGIIPVKAGWLVGMGCEMEHTCTENSPIHPEEKAALFLLSYKEKYRLSQKSIDYAVGSINSICSGVCNSIRDSVKRKCDANTWDYVKDSFHTPDLFENLKTEYFQTKFYRQHFGLVVSLLNYSKCTVSCILCNISGTCTSRTWLILSL